MARIPKPPKRRYRYRMSEAPLACPDHPDIVLMLPEVGESELDDWFQSNVALPAVCYYGCVWELRFHLDLGTDYPGTYCVTQSRAN